MSDDALRERLEIVLDSLYPERDDGYDIDLSTIVAFVCQEREAAAAEKQASIVRWLRFIGTTTSVDYANRLERGHS